LYLKKKSNIKISNIKATSFGTLRNVFKSEMEIEKEYIS